MSFEVLCLVETPATNRALPYDHAVLENEGLVGSMSEHTGRIRRQVKLGATRSIMIGNVVRG